METFQASNGYNCFFKLRNSYRKGLEAEVSKNREHVCQKVAESCELTMDFARPLMSVLDEEVFHMTEYKCILTS